MPNYDIADLSGVFAPPLRWRAEDGILGYGIRDDVTLGRGLEEIELNSQAATFVMDLLTREKGYGLVRTGVYDMRLAPVGGPAPQWPGDDNYKPAISCWVWNPVLGELRLETNQNTFMLAVSGVWDRCRTFKEATELQPVIRFTGRAERFVKSIGKTFWSPVIDIVGWVPRDKVPAFAVRPPTVKPPIPLDSQVRFALLESPDHADQRHSRGKSGKPVPKGGLEDFMDDEIPPFDQ